MPAVLVALFAAVALYEFGVAFLPLYLGHGRHRQLTPAARLRQMRSRRVRVRVHQPRPPQLPTADNQHIPWQLLAADDHTVEAAGAAARRDRDALLTGLAQIGQAAA